MLERGNMDNVTTIIVAIIGSGVLNTLLNYAISQKNKNNSEKKALRLMMKDRLRFLCMHYISQGWIYEDELDDVIAMHSCYHNDLNGNGFLDNQMSRVKNLEVRGVGVK